MAESSHPASFSRRQRWSIGLKVLLLTLIVLAVVAMLNYLSRDYFLRFYASTRTRVELSSSTRHFLRSLTNQVKVTVYYDKADPFYTTILDLLNEYQLANKRITLRAVDYLRDAGEAQKIKSAYRLDAASDKNLVIFDCDGVKWKAVDGNALAQYTLEQAPNETPGQMRRKPVAFLGEMAFGAALLDVTNPKPLKACFLTGHQEHDIESADEVTGYAKFASILKQNYIQVQSLSLLGTNDVPPDCNLLVIAGPRTAIPEPGLEKIDRFLTQGGRLLALFNAATLNRETGLERILAKWGVAVGNNVIADPEHSQFGSDVVVSAFSKHPLVNPLLGGGLFLLQPRTIAKSSSASAAPDAPRVEEVAFSGQNSYLLQDPSRKRLFPVVVAVEKGAVKGVVTERGATRMVVAGDSLLFGNRQLDLLANRDFANYAANWLLDRTQLLEGVGPRPVKEYRLVMTRAQSQTAQWLLLAGMPGSILLLGGLVWLRRRR